jgi:hypothetical protein
MVTVYGKIDSIEVNPPEEPEPKVAGAPELPDEATITVSFEEPHSGSFVVKVPNGATGGLAEGRVRVMIAEA